MKKRFSGFTLIELLIVVAIIAILAAIAVPNFLEAQTRAKVSRAKADIRTYATGIEAYAVDWNKPPREYSVALDGPLLGSATASGIMSPTLSTPIAYITTALGLDPFVNLSDNIDPDQRFFSYANALQRRVTTDAGGSAWFFGGPLTQQQRTAKVLDSFGSWYMLSIGPDRNFFNNSTNSRAGIIGREYIVYDPSNGTISFGNIIRSQRVADGAQVPTDGQLLGPH